MSLQVDLGMLQVNQDGTIGVLDGHEYFPDFPNAKVFGAKSGTMPDLVTS